MQPNFFALYDDLVKQTEPPPNFHAWCAVSAISAILGKKVLIPQGNFTVFPNLYITLVGDPGTRKSTAMGIAKSIVRAVPEVHLAPESSSREALIDDMAASKVEAIVNGQDISYWQSSAFVTEMQEFLGGRHINQAMIGFLTAIWDEPYFKERTRKGGEVIIHNPYFSLLGCCTPNWINRQLKEDVITDGFSRRTIFALETDLNTLNVWPADLPHHKPIKAALAVQSQRIFKLGGVFRLSQKAFDVYSDMYLATRDEAKKHSDKVQSYFTSKHILALKIAMCLAAGVDNQLLIGSDTMKLAIKYLAASERALDIVFSGVGRNELKGYADRLVRLIAEAGPNGLTKPAIIGLMYSDLRSDELDAMLGTLTEQGSLVAQSLDVHSLPRYVAKVNVGLPQVEPLLAQARLLEPCREQPMAMPVTYEVGHHLAPTTRQLLAQTKTLKDAPRTGKLLLGKRSLDAARQPKFSEKPAP